MNRIYESLPKLRPDKVWAEVSEGALRSNFRLLRDFTAGKKPDARLIAVVKADANCHSAEIVVPAFLQEG